MHLIILDRDGVINQDSDDFIKSPNEWQPITGSLDAIARLNQAQYRVVIASNQSGIARGLFSIETLNQIHDKMHLMLADLGGKIDAIFFCPHGPDEQCVCRKPKPGLFEEIALRFNHDLNKVYTIGDSLRDLQAAYAAGSLPILVKTGKGQQTQQVLKTYSELANTPVYPDLASAVDNILN